MRGRLVVATVVVASAAVACGSEKGQDMVVAGTAPAVPYSGPLHVPTKNLDEDSARATRIESGAAGRALECDGEIYSGGGSDPWSKGDGASTPEEGLRAFFDMEQPAYPDHGYRVERREADRVLYSFDVAGRTKVAVVVAKDQKNRPGWGPDTSASCDPAELPASYTDGQWYEIWTDARGKRVPIAKVHSSVGAEHCDWEKAHFLSLGEGEGDMQGRLYARDPDGVLADSMLTSAYDGDVRMPADAHDTGYRRGGWHLWLTDDDSSRAYVRTADGVEAWPQVRPGRLCD
ncbi:hypothetical protein [Streptomyces pseudovenezuelae]|uniref:Lipoprotein n=1 Tax=Streptomyces pseudovenezuelae TaxID=67350 RepID=A0ABT6LD20_9ACTN|nr:hypothetical protein [Streptomyces pseudovenezuelae]MDH6213820.1 hypothetical protein [Streptomyces pseudovenezuelae]